MPVYHANVATPAGSTLAYRHPAQPVTEIPLITPVYLAQIAPVAMTPTTGPPYIEARIQVLRTKAAGA